MNGQRRPTRCDGQALKQAILAAASYLESHVAAVNALNVFPVPDGDTGTNMSLTMRSAVGPIVASPEHSVGALSKAIAYGALMGARGNSGVILSQIIRGFAKAIEFDAELDGQKLAVALEGATRTAYQGVGKPVEGTILTVIRKSAEGARVAADNGLSTDGVLAAATEEARLAVIDTPNHLKVLKDAGVVDAGGQGLYLMLEGALRWLRGESIDVTTLDQVPTAPTDFRVEDTFGYCTQFLVQGRTLSIDEIRGKLEPMGDSVIVVGDADLVRVHFHTFDPGAALSYAVTLGILRSVSVENMSVQHDVWAHDRNEEQQDQPQIETGLGIIAVAAGDGFVDLFKSMGVTSIVPGGQTMNPSTQDLVAAINAAPQAEVVLLPNNGNILMAARQAAEIVEKRVAVIPSDSMCQGVAAVLALQFDAAFDENVEVMTEAAKLVDTGEITIAVRDATFDGFTIASGQAIGLVNGRMAAVGDTSDEVLAGVLVKLRAESASLLTLYYGEDQSAEDAERVANSIRDQYPEAEVETVDGGQPFYNYLIARE